MDSQAVRFLSEMTKRSIKNSEWVAFSDVVQKVPKQARKDSSVWETTAKWIEASSIPEGEVMSATKKFTDVAPRGKNPAKKHVMVPYTRLVEKLEEMLISEDVPVEVRSVAGNAPVVAEAPAPLPRVDIRNVKRESYIPVDVKAIVLGDNEGFVVDDEVVHLPVYGERTFEGIRFPESVVGNLLKVTPLSNRLKTTDPDYYEMLLCEDQRSHYFYTMTGLLREIMKKTESVVGKAMRVWVVKKIFNSTYAAPEERVRHLQSELATVVDTFGLSASTLCGELVLCLGKVSDLPEDIQTSLKDWGPDAMVYRHTHSGDISTRLKNVGGVHPDGRLVHFMIGNKGAAEAIDKNFKDTIAAKGIVSHGKMFTTDDEAGIIKMFKSIVRAQDGVDPNIALYRDIQTDLDAALVEVKFLKAHIIEKDARLAENDAASSLLIAEKDARLAENAAERNLLIAEKDARLKDKDAVIEILQRSAPQSSGASRSLHVV